MKIFSFCVLLIFNILNLHANQSSIVDYEDFHEAPIQVIQGAAQRDLFLSADREGKLAVYFNGQRYIPKEQPHQRGIIAAAFTLNNKKAVTADQEGLLVFWDIEKLKVIKKVNLATRLRAVFLKSNLILYVTQNGLVSKMTFEDDEIKEVINLKTKILSGDFVVNNGSIQLITGDRNGTLHKVTFGKEVKQKKVFLSNSPIIEVECGLSGSNLIATTASGEVFNVRDDLNSHQLVFKSKNINKAVYPYAGEIFAAGKDNKVRKANIETGLITKEINLKDKEIMDLQLVDKGNTLVLGMRNGKVKTLNLNSPQNLDKNLLDAIKADEREKIVDLLKKGANVNGVNTKNQTVFHILWDETKHTEATKLILSEILLENGLNPTLYDYRGRNYRHLYPSSKTVEIEKRLLSYSEELNDYASKGDISGVSKALSKGADINHVDIFERTPLMYAATTENLELINILTKKVHLDLKAKNNLDETVFDINISQQIRNYLNEYSYQLNKGKSTYIQGLIDGDLEKLKEAINKYQFNPHHDDIRLAKLGKQSDVNSNLLYLLENKKPSLIAFHLENGGMISIEDNPYYKRLIRYAKDMESFETMVSFGANPNHNRYSCSNLFYTLTKENAPLSDIKKLHDKYDFYANSISCEGEPAFFNVLRNKDLDALRFFLMDLKVDPNETEKIDGKKAKSPLMLALELGDDYLTRVLINAGADPTYFYYSEKEKRNVSVFDFVKDFEDDTLLELLTSKFPKKINLVTTAINTKNIKLLKYVHEVLGQSLYENINPYAPPMYFTVDKNWQEGFDYYLSKGVDINKLYPGFENTVLQMAIIGNSLNFLEAQEGLKIDHSVLSKNGRNSAHIACEYENTTVLKKLYKMDPPITPEISDGDGLAWSDICKGKAFRLVNNHLIAIDEINAARYSYQEGEVLKVLKDLLTDRNTPLFKVRLLKGPYRDKESKVDLLSALVTKGFEKAYKQVTNNQLFKTSLIFALKHGYQKFYNIAIRSKLVLQFPKETLEIFNEEFYDTEDFPYLLNLAYDILSKFKNRQEMPDEIKAILVIGLRNADYFNEDDTRFNDIAIDFYQRGIKLSDNTEVGNLLTQAYWSVRTQKNKPFFYYLIKDKGPYYFEDNDIYKLLGHIENSKNIGHSIFDYIVALQGHGFNLFENIEIGQNYFLRMLEKRVTGAPRISLTKDLLTLLDSSKENYGVPEIILRKLVQKRDITVLQTLIENGLPVDLRFGLYNRTILMHAAQFGNQPLANYLLRAGANNKLKDSKGNRPHKIARRAGFKTLSKFISKY